MNWDAVKAALKAKGVPVPADESQLLGVALMNLGLLDEGTAKWVREQRVTPGKFQPTADELPKFGEKDPDWDRYDIPPGEQGDFPSYPGDKRPPLTADQQQMVDLYKSGATKMPDGRPIYGWLPTNPPRPILEPFESGTPPPAGSGDIDPAKVKGAADAIASNSLKRGPYKITVPGLAADSSTGPSKTPPATDSGPKPMPPGWTPPPPMEYKRSPQLTPEEFKALPRERQLQLLNPYEEGGNYSPYTDPQRGTFDASGAWMPFDYSGYAGLLSEMGKKTDYAGKYGQEVADTFSQQFMNSLEDATGDEADFVRANIKNYLTDPGNPAYNLGYQGRNGAADPISVLQGTFQKNKKKSDDPARQARLEGQKTRPPRTPAPAPTEDDEETPLMAEGTIDTGAILPLLHQILAAVGGGEDMPMMGEEEGEEEEELPSFGSDCEMEDGAPPKKGVALVISKDEEEDDGLPRFATGTISADTMPAFRPEKVSQPNATWLKQQPVAKQAAPAQPPVTVNVNAAPSARQAVDPTPAQPRQQYVPGPIAVPGTEPGIFVNQNYPGGPNLPTEPSPSPAPNPQPNPNPAPDPSPDPTPDPTPDPEPETNDGPSMEDVVAIKGATDAATIKSILTKVFGNLGFDLNDAALLREQRALAQFIMQGLAEQVPWDRVKELVRARVGASTSGGADPSPAPPTDVEDTYEEEDDGGLPHVPGDTTPTPDTTPDENAPANFTPTDIAYLNQLSRSQIPSWRNLARSYLSSRGVPMDGVSDDMLTANIDKAYALIRGSQGKSPVADVAKALKGEATAPVEDAPAPEQSAAMASSSVATASSTAATPATSASPSTASSSTTPSNSNTVELGNGFVLDKTRNVIIDTATGKEYSAGGTTGGDDAPTQILYGPDAWKNNPSLKFINQLIGSSAFNQLGGMPSFDPLYKTTVDAPNALNYGDMLQALQDPTAAAILDAIFKRHNRSLTGDAIRAGQFAPLGDARYTGEIRTA